MMDFNLPLLGGDSFVEDAFAPMSKEDVAGLVVQVNNEYRLLHQSQIRSAWESNIKSLADIGGYITLADSQQGQTLMAPYSVSLASALPGIITVTSQYEKFGFTFSASYPGYVCSGPNRHPYPPNRAGNNNRCTVFGCPGTI